MKRVLLSIAGLMYLISFYLSAAGAQSVDAAAPTAQAATTAEVPLSSQEDLQQDILKVPCDNKLRLAAVKELFLRMGATESDITVPPLKNVENVVVTVKGRSDEVVVVGAHYDKSKAGCGAVDNWSGIVILAHLYRTIRAKGPLKTFLFVGFGREEEGLVGSRAMVDAIAKEDRKRYCSMLNLDSFGFAAPQIIENLSTPKLTSFIASVAKENDIRFATATFAAGADSSSFKDKGIPAVSIHGMSNDWPRILHSAKDQTDQVGSGAVYYAHRFSLKILERLDESECAAFR